jgi:NhaP-type Na+/H+ or K+/H+ antiporter
MRKFTSLAIKHLLSTGLSIIAVFVSGFAGAVARGVVRGNYSQETQIYENEGAAAFAALLVFFIVLVGLLYTLQRTLSRNLQWLPYLVAFITCIFAGPFLWVMFSWS